MCCGGVSVLTPQHGQFQIRALPTIIWMSPDGSLLQRAEGVCVCVCVCVSARQAGLRLVGSCTRVRVKYHERAKYHKRLKLAVRPGPLSSRMIRAIADHRFFDGPEPAGAPQRANVVIEDVTNESVIL